MDYHHAIVGIDGELPEGIQSAEPHLFASGGKVVDRILVPLASDGYHVHFFFADFFADYYGDGDNRRGLNALRDRLHSLHNVLARVPARVLPRFSVPSRDSGLEENLLRWMYLLHWLGGTPNQVFHSELEFLQSKDGLATNKKLEPWCDFSTVPGFDPLPFLTLTAPTKENIQHWKQQHAEAGKRFPEVIASSLTKPIFYASANAVDMLSARELANPPASRGPRNLPKIVGLGQNALFLLAVLTRHHKCERDDGPYFEPMIQEDIQSILGWSQSTVSRAVRDLLKGIKGYKWLRPMDRYKKLCDDRVIDQVLIQLSNPRPRKELDGQDMDNFAS